MAGCGYVCASCEGQGYIGLEPCSYCNPPNVGQTKREESIASSSCEVDQIQSTEDWINSVHNGPCCGDWG